MSSFFRLLAVHIWWDGQVWHAWHDHIYSWYHLWRRLAVHRLFVCSFGFLNISSSKVMGWETLCLWQCPTTSHNFPQSGRFSCINKITKVCSSQGMSGQLPCPYGLYFQHGESNSLAFKTRRNFRCNYSSQLLKYLIQLSPVILGSLWRWRASAEWLDPWLPGQHFLSSHRLWRDLLQPWEHLQQHPLHLCWLWL